MSLHLSNDVLVLLIPKSGPASFLSPQDQISCELNILFGMSEYVTYLSTEVRLSRLTSPLKWDWIGHKARDSTLLQATIKYID